MNDLFLIVLVVIAAYFGAYMGVKPQPLKRKSRIIKRDEAGRITEDSAKR